MSGREYLDSMFYILKLTIESDACDVVTIQFLVTGNYLMRLSCVQVVGDDILVTNPKRVAKAIDEHTCNALLLKVQDVLLLTQMNRFLF